MVPDGADQLRGDLDERVFISPAHSENVNYHGTINVEVDTELAKLDPAGYRPLRPRRSSAA